MDDEAPTPLKKRLHGLEEFDEEPHHFKIKPWKPNWKLPPLEPKPKWRMSIWSFLIAAAVGAAGGTAGQFLVSCVLQTTC